MPPSLAPISPPQYRLDEILEQRLTPVRMLLVNKFSNRQLDDAGYNQFIDALKQAASPANLSSLEEQIAIVELALKGNAGFAFKKLRLDTEEEKLLWAGAIGRIASDPEQYGAIDRHPIWQRVQKSEWAQMERIHNHAHLYFSTKDKKARVGWGKPGTGFYYTPDNNYINLDLFFTLVDPDYLHVYYHEEGHRLLTVEFPKSVVEQREKLIQLGEIQKQRELSPAEIEQAVEAKTRSDMLMIFFNALEDNMVDMYSVKRFQQERRGDAEGAVLRHDVITGIIGQNVMKYDEAIRIGQPLQPNPNPKLQEQWMNLLLASAASMAMRKEFGFLPNTEEGWQRIGVEPDWLEAAGKNPGDPPIKGIDALNLLQDYARRIGDEQPDLKMYADPAMLKQKADECAAKRNQLIEEVFERFGERLIKEIIKERIEQVKKQQEKQEQDQAPQDMPPPEQGDDKAAQKPKPPIKIQIDGAAGQAEEGSSIDSGSNQIVIVVPPGSPQEAGNQEKTQKGTPGQPAGDNPSIEQLEQQAQQHEAARELEKLLREAQGKPQPGDQGDNQPLVNDSPAADQNREGAALGAEDSKVGLRRRGNLNAYQQMVLRRVNTTDEMAQLLTEIQKRQIELVPTPQELGIIPQRKPLDVNAHAHLKIAQELGEAQEHHYRRFPQETITRQPPQMTIVGLLDGSGSVRNYMDEIVGVGCALNEAANKVNHLSARPSVNFHMNLWGAQKAVNIAAPGDDQDDIAKGIEAARQCSFSSSNLTPALIEFLKTSTDQERNRGTARLQAMASNVGMSHLFIVSDGDLDDLPNAGKALRAIMEQCKKVTVDVVIIDSPYHQRGQTNMDRLIEQTKAEFGDRVSTTHVPPAKVGQGMLKALNHTLERCKEEKAIPYHEATRQYSAALDEIESQKRKR